MLCRRYAAMPRQIAVFRLRYAITAEREQARGSAEAGARDARRNAHAMRHATVRAERARERGGGEVPKTIDTMRA